MLRRTVAALALLIPGLVAAAGCVGEPEESRGEFRVIEPVPFEREPANLTSGIGVAAVVGEALYNGTLDPARTRDAVSALGYSLISSESGHLVAEGENGTRLVVAAMPESATAVSLVFPVGSPPSEEPPNLVAERAWSDVEEEFLDTVTRFEEQTMAPGASELSWSYVLYSA